MLLGSAHGLRELRLRETTSARSGLAATAPEHLRGSSWYGRAEACFGQCSWSYMQAYVCLATQH